jgi:hypothetical protein
MNAGPREVTGASRNLARRRPYTSVSHPLANQETISSLLGGWDFEFVVGG